MCLFINHLEPKIADKDIICYKLVKRTEIKGIYKSSFIGFEYIIRQLYTKQLYTNNIKIEFSYKFIKDRILSGYSIEEGMFHSYENYLSAITVLPNRVTLKCIIPKGAYYFEGYFGNYPSYASSQIKILEEI